MPAPKCLEIEKQKENGDYKCGNVLRVLQKDFYNKCYLCESKDLTSINVEHFIPHKGDKNKKFDWKNLFFCCSHCNNIKSDRYNTSKDNEILDCTNPSHNVEKWLKYEIILFPKIEVKITVLKNEKIVENTASLLNEIYNGTTRLKKMEAVNLKKRLLDEILELEDIIQSYHQARSEKEKQIYRNQMNRHLDKSSAYAAFKFSLLNI